MGDTKPAAGGRTASTATASTDGSVPQENSVWKGGGLDKDGMGGKGEASEQQGRELKRVEAALAFLKKGKKIEVFKIICAMLSCENYLKILCLYMYLDNWSFGFHPICHEPLHFC
jgi:hypothetical protein